MRLFFRMNGELFKRLIALDHGAWVISYDEPGAPQYITAAFLEACEKVEMPEGYRVALEQAKHLTEAEMKRLALIEPLLEDSIYIVDGKSWLAMAKRIAEETGPQGKRILGLYYKYLARLVLMEKGGRERGKDRDVRNFDWAIRKFYFSAKKMSLRDTYDHMLASRYMTPDGKLMEVVPSWYSFEHYYYRHGYSKSIKCSVSRGGLSNYQRNERPLYGSTMRWKDRVGAFQMDATEADIYWCPGLTVLWLWDAPASIWQWIRPHSSLPEFRPFPRIYVPDDIPDQAPLPFLPARFSSVDSISIYHLEHPVYQSILLKMTVCSFMEILPT